MNVNEKRLVDNFIKLVKINSISKNEKEVAEYLKDFFEKEFNAKVFIDNSGEKVSGNSGNVIVKIKGKAKTPFPIAFAMHMDTVGPGENINPFIDENERIIRTDGKTILGADDKSGIAEVIEALYMAKENNLEYGDIELIFTIAEEIGLLGAKNIDMSLIESKYGFALDSDDLSKIIIKAPAQNKIDVTIKGIAAHAGVAPENGISAIEVMAKAISKMRLGRLDGETTANIGVVEGGTATNIVAEKVKIKGEVRSHNYNKLEKYTKEIMDCFYEAIHSSGKLIKGKLKFAEIEEEVSREFDAIQLKEDSIPALMAENAIKNIGLKPEFKSTGGGSDANVFAGKGLNMVILGTGMASVHTVNEYIKIDDLINGSKMIYEILKQHH